MKTSFPRERPPAQSGYLDIRINELERILEKQAKEIDEFRGQKLDEERFESLKKYLDKEYRAELVDAIGTE